MRVRVIFDNALDLAWSRSDPEVAPALVRSLPAWAFAGVAVVGVVRWKTAIKNSRWLCRCLYGDTIVKY